MEDRRTTYFRAKKMIVDEKLEKGRIITSHELSRLITINICGGERSIQECLRIMGAAELIKDVGNSRFEIL